MKKYHYSDGQQQFGPFTIDELKDKRLTIDTFVWFEGLENWVKAGEIEELSILFNSITPPLLKPPTVPSPKTPPPYIQNKIKKASKNKFWTNKKRLFIGVIGGFIIILGIILLIISNSIHNAKLQELMKLREKHIADSTKLANSIEREKFISDSIAHAESIQAENAKKNEITNDYSNSNNQTKTYTQRKKSFNELKQAEYDKERDHPNSYLSVKYDINALIFSSKFVIKGNIFNSAGFASYKDVVLLITYYSETMTELSSEEFTINEFINPGNSIPYKIKTKLPKGTKKYNVQIKSATGV